MKIMMNSLLIDDVKGGDWMESWKAIPGYEGIYEASSFGRIRTAEGKTTSNARYGKRVWKQRVLKQKVAMRKLGNNTDARVDLWKDGNHKTHLVSRLVALTWVDGYKEGYTVNHINGISADNRAENLEWVSLADNIRKGFEDGLYKTQIKTVIKIGDQFQEFRSMSEASRYLGHSSGYLSNKVKNGRDGYKAKEV